MKQRKITFLLIVILVLIFIGYFLIQFFQKKNSNSVFLIINNIKIKVEVADTPFKREKGLSGKNNLADGQGMLFIFEKEDRYSFWMKGMKFPLDFIWINKNKIVEISTGIKPPKDPNDIQEVLIPAQNVNLVLEVPAGFVDQHKIKVGEKVEFQK